nr:U4/U6.U5 tri-snRNP-associated protein 1 [Pogona vitticeps]
MGSSKRHRERGEASEDPAGAPPPASSSSASSGPAAAASAASSCWSRLGRNFWGSGQDVCSFQSRNGIIQAPREQGPGFLPLVRSVGWRVKLLFFLPKTGVTSKSSSGDASLSIEETNKLRAKLGLKPLEINTVKKETGSKEDPVAADVINPIVLKQREEIREKLAAAKEKRLLNQKLGKIKTLGEDDPWLDDTAAWIERSRKLQQEKDMAEKRAKLLEEMDQEFGVSSLVEEEFGQQKKQVGYSARDLKGLTVEHTIDSFQEGQTVILTLKDKGVLEEEGGDVLVNVNIVDQEKAKKNVELRKKKPDYKPYEEEESVDDMVMFKHKTILSKYDEEIEGEKKKSFKLDSVGMADGSWERELQQIRETLHHRAQTLELPEMHPASEYFTPEEMPAWFQRCFPRGTLEGYVQPQLEGSSACPAHLHAPLEPTLLSNVSYVHVTLQNKIRCARSRLHLSSMGSSRARGRGRRRVIKEEEEEENEDGYGEPRRNGAAEQVPPSDDLRVERMDISSGEDEDALQGPDSPAALEEDEAEEELQKQLEKGRKLRQIQQLKDSGEKVIEIVKKLKTSRSQEDDDELERKGAIVFNATSEFCRTLGEIPTYGLAGNREDQEELMDFERDDERSAEGGSDSEGEENIGWSTVNLDEEKQQQDFSTSSTTILDEEPIVNRGLAAALMLCQNKGLLETTVQKVARVKAPKTLPSAVYCIEDKMAIDDKYSRREEYRGFTQDFKEKDGYKPDVKIEYVDETGRKLTPKEAFRQLSHRFHGKGSGKMKTERRMKKLDEEALLKKMSSSDTPLGTVALLQEKQKAQKTPYIVLSGSGKSMNANTITK